MSSLSNSWISEAWKAAPRAERSDGLIAVGDVDGERTVDVERTDCRMRAILGV